MSKTVPIFVAGEWIETDLTKPNISPQSGDVLSHVCQADGPTVERAIAAAVRTFPKLKAQPTYQRSDLCRRVADLLRRHQNEMAELISLESGKPIRYARAEAERATFTFELAAEQAALCGEGRVLNLDRFRTGANHRGWVRRVPIGPTFALSPFNFPLNLTAHKIAPALACGCPVIVKPSPHTPQTVLMLAKICEEAGILDGSLSVIPCSNELAEAVARDERIKLLTFTGSAKVGWHLKSVCGKKRVVLELGSNSTNVVHEDAKDLDAVVDRLVVGSFAAAGQVCIKVQRVLIHRPVFELVARKFVEQTQTVRMGDPKDDDTVVGPLIDEAAARRVEEWVATAQRRGAKVLIGGIRHGNYVEPTVMTNVPVDDRCVQHEIFGPVAILEPYDDFEAALHLVNATPYGLQAGLYTQDVARIFRAADVLDVGGLIVNDYSTFRVDNMPYGGMKDSGFGREGFYESVEEFTEPKLLVLNVGETR